MTYASRTGTFSVLRGESPGAQVDFKVDTATDLRVLKVTNVTVSTAQPGTDLVPSALGLAAGAVLRSGNTVTLQWSVGNAGSVAAGTSWIDRLVVRNLDTNEVLADLQVPYDVAVEGALAGGSSVQRQTTVTLPPGNRGAGNLSFAVTLDVANTVTETNPQGLAEDNNTFTVNLVSALAPYPDLVVTDIAPTPAQG